MTLTVIVVLVLAGWATYVAFRDEKMGRALLVGIAVVGVLYLLLGPVPGLNNQDTPSTSLTPSASPTPSESESPSGSPSPTASAPR